MCYYHVVVIGDTKMKKLFTILALLIVLAIPANATSTPVQILQDFSLTNPSPNLLVKVLANLRLSKDIMLHEGFYVYGNVQRVGNTLVFIPTKYQNFHNEVFEITEQYPATFVEVIEPAGAKDALAKDSKIVIDFQLTPKSVDNSVDAKYQGAPTEGISAVVNQSDMIIYDNTIPQTMKDFPGAKLNSFDNGSNFNIPRRLIIQPEKWERNINSLKENK